MKTEKINYENPRLQITLLEAQDIITTSGGAQGSLGWDDDGNIDGGGWT